MQVNQVRKTEKWGENQKNWTEFELVGSSSSPSSSCQGSTVQCIHISICKNYPSSPHGLCIDSEAMRARGILLF